MTYNKQFNINLLNKCIQIPTRVDYSLNYLIHKVIITPLF